MNYVYHDSHCEAFSGFSCNCLKRAVQKTYEAVGIKFKENKVTRIEVIDNKGRSYVNWDENNKVTLEYQDQGRTLKIFIKNGTK